MHLLYHSCVLYVILYLFFTLSRDELNIEISLCYNLSQQRLKVFYDERKSVDKSGFVE